MMFEELRMLISMEIFQALSGIDWMFLILAGAILITSIIFFALRFLGGVGSEVHAMEPEHPHRRTDDPEDDEDDIDEPEEDE
jgi:hypothetical protein